MTESRSSYSPPPDGANQYDENGLDEWGYTAAQKQAMLTKLAARFAAESGTMAALLKEYQRIESISEETLRQRLGIEAERFTYLSLCLRPREEHFAEDVRKLAEVSGAPAQVLANVVRAATLIKTLPPRVPDLGQNAEAASGARTGQFGAMAARDRSVNRSYLREENDGYSAGSAASAPAAPASAPPETTIDESKPASDEPPVDPGNEA